MSYPRPNKGEASTSRALNEGRADPGDKTLQKVNPPSKLSPAPPKGRNNTFMKVKG